MTIGGDSAGGASVDLHLSAYGGRDDGLFRAAAAESQSFGPQFTVAESQYQYDALLKRVKCADLACLRALDVSVIAENNINIPTPGGGGGNPVYMYSNVIDGDFVTDYTYNLFSQGKFVKVPTIWGGKYSSVFIYRKKADDKKRCHKRRHPIRTPIHEQLLRNEHLPQKQLPPSHPHPALANRLPIPRRAHLPQRAILLAHRLSRLWRDALHLSGHLPPADVRAARPAKHLELPLGCPDCG